MKIVTVVGARPQFIKAAAVSREFSKNKIDEIIVHTGQHYDTNMSQVFFETMDIPKPKYNLEVGQGSISEQTAQMISKLPSVYSTEKPDLVLVYGDTTSTLAGSLAAAQMKIPVAHVESGLRSYNNEMPEELNRRLTDHISQLLFCPTDEAVETLVQEGISKDRIYNVGDVMFDSALYYSHKARGEFLSDLKLKPKEFVLVTIHRAENTDNVKKLSAILNAINHLAEETPVLLPLHPRTKKQLGASNLKFSDKVRVTDPLNYFEMIAAEKNCKLIMTDSGGVQKEAFFFKVPCVTLRTESEWVDLVKRGYTLLANPSNQDEIVSQAKKQLAKSFSWDETSGLFGKGDSSLKITQIIQKEFKV